MLPCPSCTRHVLGTETACPFCASPLHSTKVRRLPRAAIVIAVGSVLTACGPAVPDAGDSIGSSSAASTSGTPSPTTEGPDATSTTSTPGTTDPTMAMTSGTTLGTDSTGGTTEVDDTLDTACGFYGGCPVDEGDLSYECDLFMDDCPVGEKCAPWANDGGDIWNASRCSPIAPDPGSPADPCVVEGSGVSGIDTCVLGSMCFYVDPETNEGTCVEMCGGSEDDPTCLEGTCISQYDGGLPLCFETCDPKAPTCAKGESCQPVDDPALDTHVCTPS